MEQRDGQDTIHTNDPTLYLLQSKQTARNSLGLPLCLQITEANTNRTNKKAQEQNYCCDSSVTCQLQSHSPFSSLC